MHNIQCGVYKNTSGLKHFNIYHKHTHFLYQILSNPIKKTPPFAPFLPTFSIVVKRLPQKHKSTVKILSFIQAQNC